MAAMRAGTAKCKPGIILNVLTKEVVIKEECILLIVTLAYIPGKKECQFEFSEQKLNL